MTEEPRVVTAVTSMGEAELVRNLLADQGIPAMIRPQSPIIASMQADGSQSILVPASAYERAYEIINGAPVEDESSPSAD
jgi:hypothetical protein